MYLFTVAVVKMGPGSGSQNGPMHLLGINSVYNTLLFHPAMHALLPNLEKHVTATSPSFLACQRISLNDKGEDRKEVWLTSEGKLITWKKKSLTFVKDHHPPGVLSCPKMLSAVLQRKIFGLINI